MQHTTTMSVKKITIKPKMPKPVPVETKEDVFHPEYLDHEPGVTEWQRKSGGILRDEPEGVGIITQYIHIKNDICVSIIRTPTRIILRIEDEEDVTHIDILVIPELHVCTVITVGGLPTYRKVTGTLLDLAFTIVKECRVID